MNYRGRFAPSPTGPLHWGSLSAALLSWVDARRHSGQWLIRIEDLDPPREIAGMAQQHIETLKQFGLQSDEPVIFQSDRHPIYQKVLNDLRTQQRVFDCYCTRTQLEASGGIHRQCVAHADRHQQQASSYRLKVEDIEIVFNDRRCGEFKQRLAESVGDVVLQRADGYWAYQLAVVVDDATQNITHIVRGEDLLDSTPRQIYLQRVLGYLQPTYLHLPLLRDREGRKLSKSEGDDGIDAQQPLRSYQMLMRLLHVRADGWQSAASIEQFLDWAVQHLNPVELSSNAAQPG
jgi:glutamyl-Q tRNA(Asp) synthetase